MRSALWSCFAIVLFVHTAPVDARDQCDGCENGGTCVQNSPHNFVCRCAPGFTGDKCQTQDYCRDLRLASEGVDDICFNGGKCTNTPTGFKCKCLLQFQGERCEDDVDECLQTPCQNGGFCVNEHPGFHCNCPIGFNGTLCENNIDDCVDNPCYGDAKCIDGQNRFICECPPGYYGYRCQIQDDCVFNNPCKHGSCDLDQEYKPKCKCESGYLGDFCEQDLNECEWDPCADRGFCENFRGGFKCHCNPGWEGKDCSHQVDYCARHNPCKNGAACINKAEGPQCVCVVGFSGMNCEIRDDKNCKLPCENGGRCMNSTHCLCPNSYTGFYCEQEKPDPCYGDPCVHGVCHTNRDYDDFRCLCEDGYTGRYCEKMICPLGSPCVMQQELCAPKNPCLNGGDCVNLGNTTKCHCKHGFLGPSCELQNSTVIQLTASENSDRKGTVVVILVGDREMVRRHVSEVLSTMNSALNVDVKMVRDSENRPMMYEWDSVKGPGALIDVDDNLYYANDNGSEYLVDTSTTYRGVFLMLNVDTTLCYANPTNMDVSTCPTTLAEAAKALMSSRTQTALKPLGIQVQDAESPIPKSIDGRGFWFTVFVGSLLTVLLVLSMYTVLTNLNKHRRDQFDQVVKKGSLLYKANAKRNPKTVSAAIFVPPMEKPLICNVQTYDYMSNPQFMSHYQYSQHNFALIPSQALSPTQDQPRVIPIDECALLAQDRASYEEDLHSWVRRSGPAVDIPLDGDPNREDHVRRTALHWIFESKKEEYCMLDLEMLYRKGANLNAFDMAGDSPLMLAIRCWHNDVVVQLIKLGADPTLPNDRGLTPLHVAVQMGNQPAFNELLSHENVQVDASTFDDETPLKLVAMHGVVVDMARQLLVRGAQVDYTGDANKLNGKRRTALHEATAAGNLTVMEILLEHQANVDAKDSSLQTPLHIAAAHRRLPALQLLLRWNANRTLEDIDGQTPVQVAQYGLFDIGLRELLGSNASTPESIENRSSSQQGMLRGMGNADTKKNSRKPGTTSKRKHVHLMDSPPTKQSHLPSTMLSPSSERCTPPQTQAHITMSNAMAGCNQRPFYSQNNVVNGYYTPTQAPHLSQFYQTGNVVKLSPEQLQRPCQQHAVRQLQQQTDPWSIPPTQNLQPTLNQANMHTPSTNSSSDADQSVNNLLFNQTGSIFDENLFQQDIFRRSEGKETVGHFMI